MRKESLNEVTNQSSNLPSTRIQTTEKPNADPLINQPPPFKLTPVLPPSKNKVATVDTTSKQQPTALARPNHQLVKTTQKREITIIHENDNSAMILADIAIVVVVMSSFSSKDITGPCQLKYAPQTDISNQILLPSTRDESSDLSLGEREQPTTISSLTLHEITPEGSVQTKQAQQLAMQRWQVILVVKHVN